MLWAKAARILVLEEYEHAVARGAKIYAEIVGYGNTNDAYHMTAPHPEAQGRRRRHPAWPWRKRTAIRKRNACIINAHGTSTPLNDKAETMAVKKALGDKALRDAISAPPNP